MSGGGFNFMSSPRLLVFWLLVLRRSFNLICSLLGGTTVGEDDELRWAAGFVWTTLVTVMVCLEVVPADGLVTTMVPSDGNWFSWFKTKVVVEGCGFSYRKEGTQQKQLFMWNNMNGSFTQLLSMYHVSLQKIQKEIINNSTNNPKMCMSHDETHTWQIWDTK